MLKKYLKPIILNRIFIAVIAFSWLAILFDSYEESTFYFGDAVRGTGELAWNLLIFVIFVSLGQKIARLHFPKLTLFNRLLPLRKNAGIFAFLIGFSHAAFEFVRHSEFLSVTELFTRAFTTENAMIFGSVSFLIMLPLFLTSTTWAVKKMGYKSWKNLQRLAHVAFIAAALHVALIHYFAADYIDFEAFGWLGAYIVGYAYLWTRTLLVKKAAK